MFNNYGYTDFHELNLDWLLRKVRELSEKTEQWIKFTEVKYADPITWDKSNRYEATTIVIYNNDGYLSKQEVPAGIEISNKDYWLQISFFSGQLEELNEKIDNRTLDSKRKYVFVGDSYNTEYHHGGWASKVINSLGLTIGVNAWNSGVGGSGFHNNMFYEQLVNIANSMTEEQKASITDVVIVGSVNDWSAGYQEIVRNVQKVDNYVVTTFPAAKYWIIFGGWSYENDTIRSGIVSAYDYIQEGNIHAKIINDAFYNFIDPYFLEDDMTHPTESGMNILGKSIVNILNGGKPYQKDYVDRNARFSGISIYGNISKNGVHIYKNDSLGFSFDNVTVPAPSSDGLLVGTATNNNLFMRNATFSAECMYNVNNTTFKYGRVLCTVKKNSDRSWSLYVKSNSIVEGEADYPVHNVYGIYLTFDSILDYYAN